VSLVPVFEIGVWNSGILLFAAMLFHALPPLLMMGLSKGDLKRRFSEIPTTPPLSKAEKSVKSLSNLFLILLLAYSIFLPLQLGTIWLYAGLAVFLPGFIGRQVGIVPWITTSLDKPVTTGLYRYSRHPIYLTLIIQVIGVGIASASWLFILLTTLLAIMINTLVIPEERLCLEIYGDTYREYMNRTPRWIGLPKSG